MEFVLREECPAEQPAISLLPGDEDDALKVLTAASNALRYDMDLFVLNDLAKTESSATIRFVKASFYSTHSLIASPVEQISRMPSVSNQQLDQTRDVVKKLLKGLETLRLKTEKAGWALRFSSLADAEVVPSASPYQLLFEALLSRDDIRNKLLAQGDQALLRMVFAPVIAHIVR
jgi:hypothetical protein